MRLHRWKRRTIILGIALVASTMSVIPFLEGHALHKQFDTIGKFLIYLSMCLLSLFVGSAALTYNFCTYWRSLRKENHAPNSHSK